MALFFAFVVPTWPRGQLRPNNVAFLDHWDTPEYFNTDADAEGAARFKDLLLWHYKDNGIRAWRKSLDKDGNMRVCWHEFQRVVSAICHSHPQELAGVSVAGIWRHLDPWLSGWLTLEDFFPRGYATLAAFARWSIKEHGAVSKAYKAIVKDSE